MNALRLGVVLALLAACDGGAKKDGAASASAKPEPAKTAPAPSADKPKAMPPIICDNLGVMVGSDRFDFTKDNTAEKMTKAVKALPIDPDVPVVIIGEKKAKTLDVVRIIAELGAAGVTKITVKTEGRNDLPKEVHLYPEVKVTAPPGCSVSAMVLKDLSTAVWNAKGTIARRQRKGHAGPDLSLAGEVMVKELEKCDSDTAFVAAEEGTIWELTFNLAATMEKSDTKKRIMKLVLLKDAVAGRQVAGAK